MVAAAAAVRPAAQPSGPNPEGVPYIVVAQPCGGGVGGRSNGALLVNPDSGGVHFIEHKDEVIFAGERGGVRHFYMDGRAHPSSMDTHARRALCRSVRGEHPRRRDDRVHARRGTGGGVRTAETVLVERFEVSPDGKRLTITYTWNDPKVYQKPHVYRYHFERAPTVSSGGAAVSYALEEWCDAGDPVEKQSIVPPKQIIK